MQQIFITEFFSCSKDRNLDIGQKNDIIHTNKKLLVFLLFHLNKELMKPKLLTKRQQLGIFNCADPIAVMREYVSYSPDVLFVAQKRLHTTSLEKFVSRRKNESPVTEMQKQMFLNLSEKDANEIFFEINGHIYPEVLIKILDTFPKEVSKELLLEYGKYCDLPDEVLILAISVLGKDSKEMILKIKYLGIEIFNKIFRVFGKEEAKKIVIELSAAGNLDIDEKVEAKFLRIYSNEDLKDLLKCFIKNGICIDGELFCKIFDVCSSKEEIEELLDLALENDMDIWYETLDKIVEYFPSEEAGKYLERFFEETSPGRCEYDDDEKEEYYNRLLTDEE